MKLVNIDRPYELGVQLNIDDTSLNMMRADNRNEPGRQLIEVFDLYLRQSEEASWVEVATALRAIGEKKKAKIIMEKFGTYYK